MSGAIAIRQSDLTTPPDVEGKALNPAAAAFLEQVEGKREVPSSVPIIKIDHKQQGFKLPSGELVAEVAGYPIFYFQTRGYYAKPFNAQGKGEPPDCFSNDMVAPSGQSRSKQSDLCATCVMSKFGTARDGKSQACSVRTWLFLLNKEFGIVPLMALIVPASSIRVLFGSKFEGGYLSQATAKHQVYEIVWSQFRLKPSDGGIHVVLDPIMGPAATPEIATKLVGLRNHFRDAMDRLREKAADLDESGNDTSKENLDADPV